jgi:hypothetical protein
VLTSARAREKTASFPIFGIEPNDRRYPLAKVLHDRFGWEQITPHEWEDFEDWIANEYPTGTALERERDTGWVRLADWFFALPQDEPDPKRAFWKFSRETRAERLDAADRRIAESDAHKQAVLHPSIVAALSAQDGEESP